MNPTILHTAQITALALVPRDLRADALVAGSNDGSIRMYDLATGRVSRAVRALGDEVASIAVETDKKRGPWTIWVACGRRALQFDLSEESKMVQTASDAKMAIDLCEEDEEEDALNEVRGLLEFLLLLPGASVLFVVGCPSLLHPPYLLLLARLPALLCPYTGTSLPTLLFLYPHSNLNFLPIPELQLTPISTQLAAHPSGTHLAFCTDAGAVGVLDRATGRVKRMRGRHENICASVRFVPDRPRELVSGGYDHVLLHADFDSGAMLGRQEMPHNLGSLLDPTGPGMSLAPPFIIALAMSPARVLAAGLADGRVWVGVGGEVTEQTKSAKTTAKKKKTKKWEGLNEDGVLVEKVADGPVVAVAFKNADTLLTCSLLGQLTEIALMRERGEVRQLHKRKVTQLESMAKVNALVADERYVVVGGVGRDGAGVVEVMHLEAEGAEGKSAEEEGKPVEAELIPTAE
ncbi:hypothetical protein BD626DRAFT_569735 [Schizophyllum amplum]|uniref:Uncharacterized protein n=1 Tax=Schizophyllum amplum TaxID=97359 RepID=A0A550CD22_9AGAR|nr:hypothetical protein BD626DRAFT_569735 [Auriculariopsis ampla]